MKCFWEKTKVDGDPVRVYLSDPEGADALPGIVLIHHQDGINQFVREMTLRTAKAGYFVAAADLYHRDARNCQDDGPTRRARLRDDMVIKDVTAAIEFLKNQKAVDCNRIGILGFCMGGRVAYLMAAVSPDLRASVAYYGGHIFTAWGEGPTAFDRTADIRCPILGHFGEDDQDPSPEDMRKLDAELNRFGKIHEFYSYPNAGHGFMRTGSKGYSADADKNSWPRTLDFLHRYLADVDRPAGGRLVR